jgi:hypothetical protein
MAAGAGAALGMQAWRPLSIGAATGVQAVQHAVAVLLAAGPGAAVAPAAKALLATLAKLLATAHAANPAWRAGLWVRRAACCNAAAAVWQPEAGQRA